MSNGLFDNDKYIVEFDLLTKAVATNEDLNSVIMHIIATSKVCSFANLSRISNIIFNKLKEKYKYDDTVLKDFADCVSGLKYYRARHQMECVKKHLPHVSKLCTSIMSQTKITDAMIMDQKIKDKAFELLEDIANSEDDDSVNLTQNKLLQLQSLSSIAYKNNPIIEKAINRYALEEKDVNIDEIMKNFVG